MPDHGHGDPSRTVTCAVLTVSDSRTLTTDASGPEVEKVLTSAGHETVPRGVVDDDEAAIRRAVETLVGEADVIVATGGTGPAATDVTPEAIEPLVVKRLPGVGERFRRESEVDVGTAAMFSRAFAAVVEVDGDPAVVVCLPGSPAAAKLGAELIVDGLGHLVALVDPDRSGS